MNSSSGFTLGLTRLLADTYELYFSTQAFHWNVIGTHFLILHQLIEKQYGELNVALDSIANRIRTLGGFTPINFELLNQHSSLEFLDKIPEGQAMVEYLIASNKRIAETCLEVITIAKQVSDELTESLVSERLLVHEKAVWMYSASLNREYLPRE